jgi:hypothetical protein
MNLKILKLIILMHIMTHDVDNEWKLLCFTILFPYKYFTKTITFQFNNEKQRCRIVPLSVYAISVSSGASKNVFQRGHEKPYKIVSIILQNGHSKRS